MKKTLTNGGGKLFIRAMFTTMLEYKCEWYGVKTVLDAYSGVGSIGLSLASEHKKVIFIESHPDAHLNAIENAQLNQINNTEFLCGNVEDLLPSILNNQNIDLIIFDPPRKGIDPSALELTTSLKIPKIIYMSCNPSTQVRDLKILANHHYQIKEVLPYDMFPHTWHIVTGKQIGRAHV